jgi:Ca-activated chloride channel homolog
MIELAHPLWLFALLLPAARVVMFLRDRRRRHGALVFSSLAIVGRESSFRSRTRYVPFALEIAAMTLAAIALARPQHVEVRGDERMGIDVVVALDSSGSMAAEDFQPRNRYEVAKDLLAEFLERRVDDRIGIVTFGSRAATRVPITFDRAAAIDALGRTKLGDNGDGTAIGHAIATSVNRLAASSARSKVILLLTDGVNNAGSIDPATATALAAQQGIRIYTIGVGSRGQVPVPVKVQNRFTGEIETSYQLVRVDLDETLLSGIAKQTGALYFRATDEQALSRILATIDSLEKSGYEGERRREAEELYEFPAALAFVLFLLAMVGSETFWLRLPA